jgi:hypothetical protein
MTVFCRHCREIRIQTGTPTRPACASVPAFLPQQLDFLRKPPCQSPPAAMGSRVAAALIRRGRYLASSLLTPRLPRSALAPAPPHRVGSASSCGGGGGGGGGSCLLPPRSGPSGAFSYASRFGNFHAFRSLAPKVSEPLCSSRVSLLSE